MTVITVSIITPSLNQAQFIDATIRSVLNQTYPHIEYLIMDGQSQDGTLDILKQYDANFKWISEYDKNQCNAINKGFGYATGDIYAYLNADDLYLKDTIRHVVDFFEKSPDAMFMYGDAIAIDKHGNQYSRRHHVQPTTLYNLVHGGDYIVQPAAFWRAELWDEIGEMDESYLFVFDYEYWIRVAQKYQLHYLPIPLAKERIHSQAKTSYGGLHRIGELDTLGKQYGGVGIASNFRPEAASVYFHAGLEALRDGELQTSLQLLKLSLVTNNSFLKLMMYLIARLIFGSSSIPILRLHFNRIREFTRRARRRIFLNKA